MLITPKEVAKSARTLICLLQSLIEQKVLVELRNDHFVSGTLISTDCYMNIEIRNAYIWSLDEWILFLSSESNDEEVLIQTDQLPCSQWLEKQTKVDFIFIKGCRIRYFYLPESANVFDLIEKQLCAYRQRRTSIKIDRPFNWKTYRKKLKLMSSNEPPPPGTTD